MLMLSPQDIGKGTRKERCNLAVLQHRLLSSNRTACWDKAYARLCINTAQDLVFIDPSKGILPQNEKSRAFRTDDHVAAYLFCYVR
jgi:hypothetical protein